MNKVLLLSLVLSCSCLAAYAADGSYKPVDGANLDQFIQSDVPPVKIEEYDDNGRTIDPQKIAAAKAAKAAKSAKKKPNAVTGFFHKVGSGISSAANFIGFPVGPDDDDTHEY
jgi:hypothetical protein